MANASIPATPDDGSVVVCIPRVVLSDLLLALGNCVRRLQSHAPRPGVVDSAVQQHAQHCLIQGSAALRLAESPHDPLDALRTILVACTVAEAQHSADRFDWQDTVQWIAARARDALPPATDARGQS